MRKNNTVQQKSDEWKHLRKGKITGKMLSAIMGTKYARQEAFYEVLGERLTVGVESDDYETAMERGNRLEPEAIAAFEFETGKKVECVGLCQDDDNPNIANSPDGYIKGTNDEEALEIKAMGGKNHIKLWLTNEVPDDHFWQVIQYFVVNEKLEKLYFVGYNPEIPVKPLVIIEVQRKDIEAEIENARKSQKEFLIEVEEQLKKIIKL